MKQMILLLFLIPLMGQAQTTEEYVKNTEIHFFKDSIHVFKNESSYPVGIRTWGQDLVDDDNYAAFIEPGGCIVFDTENDENREKISIWQESKDLSIFQAVWKWGEGLLGADEDEVVVKKHDFDENYVKHIYLTKHPSSYFRHYYEGNYHVIKNLSDINTDELPVDQARPLLEKLVRAQRDEKDVYVYMVSGEYVHMSGVDVHIRCQFNRTYDPSHSL